MEIDKKAIQIIKSKYWQNGWINEKERFLTEPDADYIASKGWDLGIVHKTHENLVREVIEMSQDLSLEYCASLFSNSLATRSLYNRSFLSSIVQAQKLPNHEHLTERKCAVCGLYTELEIDQDVMLFEKIMWGGVRLTSIEYVWLDLKLLKRKIELIKSCNNDFVEFEELLKVMAGKSEKLSASKFSSAIQEIKGNKAEREIICGILGICDILNHPDHPGFLVEYRPVKSRQMPNQHYIDLEWPYCWYNSAFGVNFNSFEIIKTNNVIKRTVVN